MVSEDIILIIKARFKSDKSNIYGQILIVLNNKKEFDSFNLIVSTYPDIYNIELNTAWDIYDGSITDIKLKGQYNNSMTASLTAHFNNFSSDLKSITQIYEFAYNNNLKEMETLIFNQIYKIFHETSIQVDTMIDEIPARDFEEIKLNRNKPVEEKKEDDNKSASPVANIILIDLILSPVKGKPIYNLKIGDRIMIKIRPGGDRANYIIDDLGIRRDKEILPIPAEIIDIKAGNDRKDPLEIMTKIAPGVYGKAYENEKQVKLRMYDPAIDEDIILRKKPKGGESTNFSEKTPIFTKGTLIMLLFLFIIITLLIILINMK